MDLPPDFLFKIILIGDSGVGKTSLMRRYTDGSYTKDGASTIGVDFKIKTLEIEKKRIKLQIWDTAGQERFRAIVAHYYRGANGILLVFDLTSHESFEHLKDWMKELEKRDVQKSTQIKIIGNKVDCASAREVSADEIHEFMNEYKIGINNYTEVSAQNDINVEKTFIELTKVLMKTCKGLPTRISSKVAFKADANYKKSGCC